MSSMKWMRALLAVVTVAAGVSVVLVGRAEAKRTTFAAVGQAQIGAHRTPLARAQAVNQALRRAVEQASEHEGGPSEGEDPRTDQAIYDRLAAFVPRTAVIGEHEENGVLSLELAVDVDLDALDAALAGRRGVSAMWMNANHAQPSAQKVLILATPPEASTGATNALLDAGLHLAIDAAGADLVLTVRGAATSSQRPDGMWSAEARVTTQLERTRDHRVVAAASHAATQQHILERASREHAFDEAARVAAAEVLRKLNR
jgi:hypothetical protein